MHGARPRFASQLHSTYCPRMSIAYLEFLEWVEWAMSARPLPAATGYPLLEVEDDALDLETMEEASSWTLEAWMLGVPGSHMDPEL
mmetsp:Transcript_62/g.171  ORF Transcript_62/g.171 Transcript_62/m.171 type:complete len:86 (+) Transcript_62:504-761(+)